MLCVFGWCVSWVNFFFAIVSSITATVLTLLCLSLCNRIRNRMKFSKAKGKYRGDGTDSDALIKYKGGNRLSITVTHDEGKRTWEGLITMDNEHYGTLGWKYTDNSNEFGFKKCIVSKEDKKVFLISVDLPEPGGEVKYGTEVLTKK